jgi:phenylpropionate dioxygenase-like ring-hydroxylating dioxygenase large terminal subunit
MFINFWYPAEESDKVTTAPLKVRMLGLNFVLWRDSAGQVHCVHNTCSHRGGSLGDGRLTGDHLQCPYHGWVFDGAGVCQRIPSLGPLKSIPARSRIDAYPVEERYGLVFVFLGDLPAAERPHILDIPEHGQPGWRTLHMRYRWQANYVRLVENQSDPSHVEYVHAGFGMAGKRPDYNVPKITVKKGAWGAGAMTEFMSPELPDQEMKKMQGPGAQRVDAGSGFHAISTTWTHIHFNATDRMHIYLFAVPRDEMDLEIFLVNQRNCMLDEGRDRNFLDRMGVAVEEDRVVIEKLDPPIPSKEAIGEFIVPADDVLMAYRERLGEWQAKGWRMDLEAMSRNRGRIAYAIPSPARREQPKDWAVTPVPLLGR